jgi:hypothetical protein
MKVCDLDVHKDIIITTDGLNISDELFVSGVM